MKLLQTMHAQFARRIARNILTVQQQLKQVDNIEDQFIPLSENMKKQQAKIRQKITHELSYVGEDPTPHKLVNRPAKGAVWGLAGQLIIASKKVQLEGLKDDADEIIQFLQIHQVKNIYLHDWMTNQQQDNNRRRYALIGSCFSARHCWKTGLELKNAFNRNSLKVYKESKKKYDPIQSSMSGQRDQEWAMVEYKDYEIHLMTEQQRQSVDLQWKWNNPVPEETIDKWVALNNNKKRRKNQFEDIN